MDIHITKKDVIWSYVAQFFNLGYGLITLPIILHVLDSSEVGLNYLMMTISTMVALLDFGFAPQFSKNITYVFSGAQTLQKEGAPKSSDSINYTLLANVIHVAKRVYSIIAVLALVVLLTAGTIYIYHVTGGFTSVRHALLIWLIFSISVFFNVYYVYYSSLLIGRGLVQESKKALIASKCTNIFLTIVFLYGGMSLLGVVVANLVSPFVGRFLSYRAFYDKRLKVELSNVKVNKADQVNIFLTIWYNTKKLGVCFVVTYIINKFSLFLSGLFLSLEEIASYGLMIQLMGFIANNASIFYYAKQPQFVSYKSTGDNKTLIREFSFTLYVYYLSFIVGAIGLLTLGPSLIELLRSNTYLPSSTILFIYAIVMFLEGNHSLFCGVIACGNEIPYVKSSIFIGIFISIGSYLSLSLTDLGILGLVLVQGLCQAAYANWRWPYIVCRDFHINIFQLSYLGFKQSIGYLKQKKYVS